MRVLIASDYYPPFIGGAHRQTRLLAHELAERGHDVAVATLWYAGAAAEELDDGITVYRLRQVRSVIAALARRGQLHHPAFPDPVTTWQFRRLIRARRPDVIHAYGGIAFSAAAANAGQRPSLVIAARDYGFNCPTRTLVYRGNVCPGPALTRCPACAARHFGVAKGLVAAGGLEISRPLLARRIHGLHSVSRYVEETMHRDVLRGRPVRSAIVPSFREDAPTVATSAESEILQRLDAIAEPFILFVGALRREKGIDDLVAAHALLEKRIPLVLIGTRESDTPSHLPAGVTVLENASLPEILGAWDRAAFGVFPSRLPEPLGSVVYEAMSRGKAVIGTHPGGHEDMITDGEDGLLIPAGDSEALRAAITRLVEDEGFRRRLGEAARARADEFVASVSVPQIEAFLEAVVGSRR